MTDLSQTELSGIPNSREFVVAGSAVSGGRDQQDANAFAQDLAYFLRHCHELGMTLGQTDVQAGLLADQQHSFLFRINTDTSLPYNLRGMIMDGEPADLETTLDHLK